MRGSGRRATLAPWGDALPEERVLRRLFSPCALVFSIISTTLVRAASGTTSVTANNGGGARWGFLVAIFVAVIAFVGGGAFIVVRSRREYRAMEARKASQPPDAED